MFLDVDDRYLPWKNERVVEAFKEIGFDALVHLAEHSAQPTAAYQSQLGKGPDKGANLQLVQAIELAQETFPGGTRNRIAEAMGAEPTNLILPGPQSDSPIHHAHATVRRVILSTHQFHEAFFPRNEDGLFLRDLLHDGKNVVVLLEHLSIFSTETSAVHWRAKLYWLMKRLKSLLVRS
jgi:hypothetical protein